MIRTMRARLATGVAVALVLALSPFVLSQGAEGGMVSDTSSNSIVVVGDSITALYDDTAGGPQQGWWSMVGRHLDQPVETYAQSGSGFLRRGAGCEGTVFAERDKALTGSPSILIIEGGRNDWAVCRDDRVALATNTEIATAVDDFLQQVADTLPSSTRVLVLGPPWGPTQPVERLRVTRLVQQSAEDHGFEFVDTSGTLPPQHVRDGIHPNRAGNIALAKRVLAALD